MVVNGPGTVEMVFTPADGSSSQPQKLTVFKFEGKSADGGVALSMYNTDEVRLPTTRRSLPFLLRIEVVVWPCFLQLLLANRDLSVSSRHSPSQDSLTAAFNMR